MNLHEYQSKFRFGDYGIPIPKGKVARTPQEAYDIARALSGPVVVKAQVLTGGRGKAGGVKLARTPDEAREHAAQILGMDIRGHIVRKVLIDPALSGEWSEIYLGVTNDRQARRPVLICSSEGGVEIEEVARQTPDRVFREYVDPNLGLCDYQIRNLAIGIELPRAHWRQFSEIAHALYRCYYESDATLAEINPLALTEGGLIAIDGKMSLDDNALYRHPDLEALRDTEAEPRAETMARAAGLSYVKLDGEIGCLVNGAGLAMATMDMTKLFGGAPANFLDIGGGAQADRVSAALRIILDDPNVKVVLCNIFGGITRADEVAKGIVQAVREVGMEAPMVVRLVGTNEEEGQRLIETAGLPNLICCVPTLAEAAEVAVQAAREGA
ncbi:MAG: ADP-forming succinate--CoA ligase subunit beta [Anaerolineae bacterium]